MPYTDYKQVLQDLADNIREVNGTTNPIRFVDMPDLIGSFVSPSISLYGEAGNTWKRKLIPFIGNTSGMTDMHNMFKGINMPNDTLDLSNIDTSDVVNMSHMFDDLNVSSIDLSSIDTSNVTDMSYLFNDFRCSTDLNLDLSHFDTSKVTDMRQMFYVFGSSQNNATVSLDVTGWDVSHVSNFYLCFALDRYSPSSNPRTSLSELDLSGWNTSSATNMNNMFSYANLRKIWVPSTFVATRCPADSKPFSSAPGVTCHIYTDAPNKDVPGWGTIVTPFVPHYNSTHEDYENA